MDNTELEQSSFTGIEIADRTLGLVGFEVSNWCCVFWSISFAGISPDPLNCFQFFVEDRNVKNIFSATCGSVLGR